MEKSNWKAKKTKNESTIWHCWIMGSCRRRYTCYYCMHAKCKDEFPVLHNMNCIAIAVQTGKHDQCSQTAVMSLAKNTVSSICTIIAKKRKKNYDGKIQHNCKCANGVVGHSSSCWLIWTISLFMPKSISLELIGSTSISWLCVRSRWTW